MASLTTRPNGHRWITFTHPLDRRRRTLRLGACPKRDAEAVARHVEGLCGTLARGQSPVGDALAWLAGLPCGFLDKVARVGLCRPPAEGDDDAPPPTLAGLLDATLDAKAADLKPSSVRRLRQARDRLCRHFGDGRDPATITPDDAARWRRSLLDGADGRPLSRATVRGDCGFAKTLWHDAERRGWVPAGRALDPTARGGPFAHLDAGVTAREDARFLTADEAAAVIEELPGVAWRALFGLAYHAGLRCPSETHALTWDRVDWHRRRLDVPSPKTERHRGHDRRQVPIGPELMPLLQDAYDAAEPGASRVVALSHAHKRGVYGTVDAAADRAGVPRWRPLWLTVRSSCEMRWLAAGHPSSHVAAWMGHGVDVAERHYRLLVPDASFAAASAAAPGASPGRPEAQGEARRAVVKQSRPAEPALTGLNRGSAGLYDALQSGGGENRTPVSR